jgi:hypothetical protein
MVILMAGTVLNRAAWAVLLVAACSVWAADGSREAMRIRLVSLETLAASKRALIAAKWTNLGFVDAQARGAVAGDEAITGEPDQRSPERARELLRGAAKRRDLEEERYQQLRSLQDLYQELEAIQAEIQKVRSDMQGAQQILEGHWVLTLMPAGSKTDVHLTQNGTIVSGDYSSESGQAGNLQGTFVNGVLVLERIDAKAGRNGRLEGSLSKDGKSLRGSWFSYEFSSGQPLTGAFTLDRVPEEAGP